MIPTLEREHLLSLKSLDVSFNSLNDAGLEPLLQSLASMGSPLRELNLSGNNLSDQVCKLLSDYIRGGKCKHLANVIVDDCPKITDAGRRALKIAQMKAQGKKETNKLDKMMSAAKGRDQMVSDNVEFV